MNGFTFEEYKGYSVVRFESVLHEMSWGDVEKEASEIVRKIRDGNTSRMIVDLSPMDLIQSGLVASLVRMWKATEGRARRKVVVTAPHEVVQEVLRSAGLYKVFSVVASREEGAYEIGASRETGLEPSEKHWIPFVVLPAAVLGVVAVSPVLFSRGPGFGKNIELLGLLLAAVACILSVASVFRDDGWRRAVGMISMILGLVVIGSLFMKDDSSAVPVSSSDVGQSQPTGTNGPETVNPQGTTQGAAPLDGQGPLTARGRKTFFQSSAGSTSTPTTAPDGNSDDAPPTEPGETPDSDSDSN